MVSGIVTLDYTTMKEKDCVYSIQAVDFPYIPTFLSFREGRAIVSAYAELPEKPELLMGDGCGINHPRSAGLATHIGVALDLPTIGVAKSILCGTPEEEVVGVGEFRPLRYDESDIERYWMGVQIKKELQSNNRCASASGFNEEFN